MLWCLCHFQILIVGLFDVLQAERTESVRYEEVNRLQINLIFSYFDCFTTFFKLTFKLIFFQGFYRKLAGIKAFHMQMASN